MYQAKLADQVIAEASEADVIHIEGNVYFPPSAVVEGVLRESPTPYTCPWKGECQYFTVTAEGETALRFEGRYAVVGEKRYETEQLGALKKDLRERIQNEIFASE